MKNVLTKLALTVSVCMVGSVAMADALSSIKERGTLICGTLGTSEPFSFQDVQTRQLVGYDVDVCKIVADKIGVKPEYKLLAVAARIPELNSGRVDVLAANLGYTPARAEQILFSDQYYLTPQKLLVRDSSDIQSIQDLKNKRIGATKGSSSERIMQDLLPDAKVIGYADSPAAFLSLQQRKIDAQFASELVLARLVAESPETSPTRILEETVVAEPWGLGIKQGEESLLLAVNEALNEAEANGQLQQVFDKWLGDQSKFKLQRSFKVGPIAE